MSNHTAKIEDKRVMWGKYAGTLFSEVPTSYLQWFVLNAYKQMINRKRWAVLELERRKKLSIII